MNRTLLAPLVALLLASPAFGRPAYRRALADLLELPGASKLNDCRVCHLPLKPGADESDRPHNAFGKRLAALRDGLRKAGKPSDIVSRILAVADEDSDGDGAADLLELLAGTFPGEKDSKPDAQELAAARKRLPALLDSLKGYRWRPFDRVERPPVPHAPPDGSARTTIDAFLADRMRKRGIKPRPEAPREVLIRRVTIDLTGVPPTEEELRAFLADESPDAYERVVDRLLASPRHGERWGRHWMDVWRYSDWAGFGAQIRDSQPHVWHWRDWIIESLNAGKGYDRMVVEMLAADEASPADESALRATGYLVRNYKLLSREKWLQDAVDHTAQAFLGLTLGCSRCHDHMYDPVTMKEYYQVRAVFQPHNVRTDRLPGFPDVKVNGLPRAFDADPKAATFMLLRGDDRTPDKTALSPGVPEALGGSFAPSPVALPRHAYEPNRRPFVLAEQIAQAEAAVKLLDADVAAERARVALLPLSAGLHGRPWPILSALGSRALAERRLESAVLHREGGHAVVQKHRLQAQVERLEDDGKQNSPEWEKAAKALVEAERRFALLTARNRVFVLRHAPEKAPKSKVPPAQQLKEAEKALAQAEASLRLPPSTKYTPRTGAAYPATSTGRRLAFARWIANRDNPLAARVAVNHVWLRHFGQALAPGVFDLGRNAQQPTHPELLDWLAVEFMERGWDMKALHRLVLTSAAYRRHSTPDRDGLARDPDNVTLWRYAPRRVEAEVVRDSLFFVAGRLDLKMGGPEVPHTAGLSVPRRSVYFQHAQEKQMEFLLLFDTASVTECYHRRQAIMPQQALALGNSDVALSQARLAARLLHSRSAGDSAFVARAFERLLTRKPTEDEEKECLAFLKEQTKRFAAGNPRVVPPDANGLQPASEPELRARENLLLVLLNHHEFVTVR